MNIKTILLVTAAIWANILLVGAAGVVSLYAVGILPLVPQPQPGPAPGEAVTRALAAVGDPAVARDRAELYAGLAWLVANRPEQITTTAQVRAINEQAGLLTFRDRVAPLPEVNAACEEYFSSRLGDVVTSLMTEEDRTKVADTFSGLSDACREAM